ncbi:uncharacterized protein CTHT_0018000 [Thermochaetoides thermophila DSM 1495]|uniref:Uncharacterized protein n=1 Tax=Chaetomium thermophilum (strain DSM 1495 / CBS 144.50 / IMI 039719) TaxID=759272 RepID=G0S2P6_CHATD|nr:hypothetical protein CTHT_0018000 [Thermochaetoides thermophila DSM 1495]EGS22279.1 hypothetical protein CTHT_0018000 [Thermochaetoides thermophila DSM 1495]
MRGVLSRDVLHAIRNLSLFSSSDSWSQPIKEDNFEINQSEVVNLNDPTLNVNLDFTSREDAPLERGHFSRPQEGSGGGNVEKNLEGNLERMVGKPIITKLHSFLIQTSLAQGGSSSPLSSPQPARTPENPAESRTVPGSSPSAAANGIYKHPYYCEDFSPSDSTTWLLPSNPSQEVVESSHVADSFSVLRTVRFQKVARQTRHHRVRLQQRQQHQRSSHGFTPAARSRDGSGTTLSVGGVPMDLLHTVHRLKGELAQLRQEAQQAKADVTKLQRERQRMHDEVTKLHKGDQCLRNEIAQLH